MAFARRLAQLDAQVLASTKTLVWRARSDALQQHLDAGLAQMLNCRATTRFQENIRRFAQARDTKGR